MARKKGYRNYYDYRVHQYGKRPPDEPVERGGGAPEKGRRGKAALKRALKKDHDKIALIVEVPVQTKHGQWSRVNYIATYTDGRIVEYTVPVRFTDDEPDLDAWLDAWHDEFEDYDIDYVPYDSTTAGAAAA